MQIHTDEGITGVGRGYLPVKTDIANRGDHPAKLPTTNASDEP